VPKLPHGTVTFAFTDIEGSTVLLKRLADGYADVLAAHRRLVRDNFTTHGGVEIDTQGDAFFFAFERARDAVAAAAEVQRAHVAHAWPQGGQVWMRVGLHTGEPTLSEEGYLGLDVVRAARLCGVCQGGHVLLSETTRALVGSTLPAGVSVFPLGERHLKDIDEPERVYELEIEGVEPAAKRDAAQPRSAAAVARSSERVSASERRERQKQLEDDHERRIEDYVLSVLDQSLGELAPPTPAGEAEEPGVGGVDDMAARADELANRIQLEIFQEWRDATDARSE
jgi:class 3 adenylate cyclase